MACTLNCMPVILHILAHAFMYSNILVYITCHDLDLFGLCPPHSSCMPNIAGCITASLHTYTTSCPVYTPIDVYRQCYKYVALKSKYCAKFHDYLVMLASFNSSF